MYLPQMSQRCIFMKNITLGKSRILVVYLQRFQSRVSCGTTRRLNSTKLKLVIVRPHNMCLVSEPTSFFLTIIQLGANRKTDLHTFYT